MRQEAQSGARESLPRLLLSWYGAGTSGGATLGDLNAVENLSLNLTDVRRQRLTPVRAKAA